MDKKDKTRNGGEWTDAKWHSFVTSQLRKGSMKWPPKNKCIGDARVERGSYICNGCKQLISASVVINGKRVKNVFADHILPVIDPAVGFTTWDEYIDRLYCEADNFQVLCKECHDIKTAEERKISTERSRNKKENNGKV